MTIFMSTFRNHFKILLIKLKIYTLISQDGSLASKVYNSTKYGINSIYKLCNIDWNKITKEQKKIDDDKTKLNKDHIPTNLHNISRSKLKQLITDYFLDSY